MASVALFVHHARDEAAVLARDAADWLAARGHEVRLPVKDAAIAGLDRLAAEDDVLLAGLDVALSLGGDGTMLRTVELVDGTAPVIGVNLGTLGYLAAVEPDELHAALARWESGDVTVMERMRLLIDVLPPDGDLEPAPGRYAALNEAVLGKTPSGQIARILVTVDDEPFTTYSADGLIVATPTGSTAYAWSAGGPIVAPDHEAIVLTPVAPHMLFDRSLVLSPSTCVRLEVVDDRPADLSLDGRSLGLLGAGGAIVCTASARPARLVGFGAHSFLGILKAKFGLADR
ncbi:MAG TPA: NAD(+)/NADH kinase [Acidimicrobiales bacterium]|jgi:NAD+ kinase